MASDAGVWVKLDDASNPNGVWKKLDDAEVTQ
jgi:hypothetical protein